MKVLLHLFLIYLVAMICIPLQSNAQTFTPLGCFHFEQSNGKRIPEDNVASGEYGKQEKKSVLQAIIFSLIVPGAGELYVGNTTVAKYHLIAEGGIWITYTSFRMRSKWLLEDAHAFARIHASASFNGTDEEYDVNVGNYNSMEAYNNAKLIAREYDRVYTDQRFNWQWDTDENRRTFKSQRIKSSEAKNNAKFVLGAAILNRIISAFSAGRMASRYNASLSEGVHLHFQSNALCLGSPNISLNISASF